MTRMSVTLLTLGDPGRVTGGYLYHRRLADRAGANDSSLRFVSVPALPFPLSMASGPRWLAHPDLGRADVVVVDSIAAAAVAPWLRDVRPPIVGMLHQLPGGMDTGRIRRWLQAPFDRWAYRPARILIAASEWLRDELRRQGVPRHRLEVIAPGRDLEPMEPGSGGEPPVAELADELRGGRAIAALCVANWLPRKGIVELLEALAALRADLVTLHLVGDPSAHPRYAARVRRRLRSPDLSDRVVVHGIVDPRRLARLYQAVDLFVLPSFEEPYGTVWVEAMAAGLPVIGWRAGNLPYLADHEREAIILTPGDVPALRDALARMALDAPLRLRLGAAAAERALERPTWDETAARFFTALRAVARSPPRRPPIRRP